MVRHLNIHLSQKSYRCQSHGRLNLNVDILPYALCTLLCKREMTQFMRKFHQYKVCYKVVELHIAKTTGSKMGGRQAITWGFSFERTFFKRKPTGFQFCFILCRKQFKPARTVHRSYLRMPDSYCLCPIEKLETFQEPHQT